MVELANTKAVKTYWLHTEGKGVDDVRLLTKYERGFSDESGDFTIGMYSTDIAKTGHVRAVPGHLIVEVKDDPYY